MDVVRFTIAIFASLLFLADFSVAQTRFPGDSPTRLRVDRHGQSIPLGTPGAGRGSRRTFTTGQPGAYYQRYFYRNNFGYRPYGYGYSRRYSYYSGSGLYGGNFSGGYYDVCPTCGFHACRCRGPIVLPPVAVNYGTVFGARANLFDAGDPLADGWDDNQPIMVPPRRDANREDNRGNNRAANRQPAAASPAALRRAWRYIDHGDKQFREGDFREAVNRYRKAAVAAPDLAEAQFRQGFAELAMDNHRRAAVAMERGLLFAPTWPLADFSVAELFANDDAKNRVLAELNQQLDKFPNDADAHFLIGIMQHFDGQPDAAAPHFKRTVKLTGGNTLASLFVSPKPLFEEPPIAEQPEEAPQQKPARLIQP